MKLYLKLYVRLSACGGLGLDVLLTGQVKETDGKRLVEVSLPYGCDTIVGAPLPKTGSGRALIWADPGDLCANDDNLVSTEALFNEVKRVNDLRAEEMRRGPLGGENWP
jgi:hypothetical protein